MSFAFRLVTFDLVFLFFLSSLVGSNLAVYNRFEGFCKKLYFIIHSCTAMRGLKQNDY